MTPPIERDLFHIKHDKIKFDLNNPRGESERAIISDKSFKDLVDSIQIYGILEPVIVKKEENKKDKYILIDGERRLRAAKHIDLNDIPALIAKSESDGRTLAYHVHMLRKNWNIVAETKAIKRIIDEILKEEPGISDIEIKKRIREITKASDSRINDLITLTKFDDKFIELAIEKKLNMSYLVRIERDFVNKVKSNYPVIAKKYGNNRLRNILAKKAIDGLLGNTRFLMDHFKVVFQDKKNKDKVSLLINDFLKNKNKNIQDTLEEYKSIINTGSSKKQEKDKKEESKTDEKGKNSDTNDSGKTDLNYSPIRLTRKQQLMIDDIKPKYESIGKTFLNEEKEYIEEAIYCLKNYCFKAAVLMIWATSIGRILNHISKDIPDFNSASQIMKQNNKSFYKHICTNFQLNASGIEDIRRASKDLQLLCYLCYKSFITEPDYKKLKANYDTRNDCAHPTLIKLNVNETIAIFENIYNLILSNSKL